jgi:hypothetical protein
MGIKTRQEKVINKEDREKEILGNLERLPQQQVHWRALLEVVYHKVHA